MVPHSPVICCIATKNHESMANRPTNISSQMCIIFNCKIVVCTHEKIQKKNGYFGSIFSTFAHKSKGHGFAQLLEEKTISVWMLHDNWRDECAQPISKQQQQQNIFIFIQMKWTGNREKNTFSEWHSRVESSGCWIIIESCHVLKRGRGGTRNKIYM